MRAGFLSAVAVLLASTGLAFAQPEPPGPNGGPTYFGTEYLLWFLKQPLPAPLVTEGTAASRGALGPGTSVLLGGNGGTDQDYSGVRFTGGTWITGMVALEGSGFVLGQRSTGFDANSNSAGSPVLARPIINSITGQEQSSLISFPGAFAGGVAASTVTRLWGAEADLIYNPFHACGNYPEYIVGMRYLNLNERLDVNSVSHILPGGVSNFDGLPVFAPNSIGTEDHFGTRTQFYGGQIGLRSRFDFLSCLYLEMVGKVAFGDSHEEVNIDGHTTLLPPTGPSQTALGGLLALSSNVGHYSRDTFAVVPEGTINLGCWITCNVKAFVGFNFLYWSDTMRVGDQVSREVNPTLDPRSAVFGLPGGGAARPAVQLRDNNDFWVYGLNVGLAFEF